SQGFGIRHFRNEGYQHHSGVRDRGGKKGSWQDDRTTSCNRKSSGRFDRKHQGCGEPKVHFDRAERRVQRPTQPMTEGKPHRKNWNSLLVSSGKEAFAERHEIHSLRICLLLSARNG